MASLVIEKGSKEEKEKLQESFQQRLSGELEKITSLEEYYESYRHDLSDLYFANTLGFMMTNYGYYLETDNDIGILENYRKLQRALDFAVMNIKNFPKMVTFTVKYKSLKKKIHTFEKYRTQEEALAIYEMMQKLGDK